MRYGSLLPSPDWAVGFSRAEVWLNDRAVWFLAQAAAGEAAVPAGEAVVDGPVGNPLLQFFANPLNLILISAILFMFLVARPQQKQAKAQQQALADLKKNDRVITASGIHGVVVQTDPQSGLVTLRIDENSGARMTVNRDAIGKIIPADAKDS